MSDITELERRVAAALDRIGAGLERLATDGDADGDSAALRTALEEEKMANAQLEERVKAIREKQENLVGALESEVARLRREIATHADELQRIKRVNAQLRQNNQALREANAKGVGEPHLIDKSMMAELEALRASRDADRAELDAIIGELQPLITEGSAHNA